MSHSKNLTPQQLDTILENELNENFWIYQLGVNAEPVSVITDNDFSFPFFEKGKELWEKYLPILKQILCDKERKAIRMTIDEGILGNIRELVVFIYFELTNTHNLVAGIAIPLVAIVIKKSIQNFCEQ